MGLNRDNGKEHGNYYNHWGNGKEHGNYCCILGLYWGNGKENGNNYFYHVLMGVPVIKGWEVWLLGGWAFQPLSWAVPGSADAGYRSQAITPSPGSMEPKAFPVKAKLPKTMGCETQLDNPHIIVVSILFSINPNDPYITPMS